VLEDALNTSQGLDHVCAVVVQVPQLTIVTLMCPPEWILPHDAVLLEVLSATPALVECKRVPILLEESVNTRDTTVPGILQVLQGEASILCIRLLTLQGILGPHTLTVNELSFPCLDVPVKIWDQLVLFMTQATSVMGDACLCLLRVPQIRLWDEDVTHTQHTKTTQLLGRVENDRRET